ncbi:MAG: sugar phosphate isomerase/epimerase [Clostridia bacterium]|nr:sugar phosphate isomerase/epimerase [Clostridia bacterium]
MKISVSSYSFSQLLNSGEHTQLTLIELAKEMGFDAIEFTDLCPPEGITEEEYAKQIKAESERVGLPVSSYTVGADFINAQNIEDEIARICRKVDTASILGVNVMRHDATSGFKGNEAKYKGFDQALPLLIKGCKAVTDYAKRYGIETCVENHGFFSQESLRVEKLVNGVADENFGLLIDIGNFACADDPSPVAVGRLAPYAKYVHAKDFHIKSGNAINPGRGFFRSRGGNYLRGAIIGHGDIPVMQCLSILKNSGYDGYVSIEFEGMENAVDGISTGLENLRNMLKII